MLLAVIFMGEEVALQLAGRFNGKND